jgi:ABC-type nitrate/sulfonate/bicarbonate transport system ATPase subunit
MEKAMQTCTDKMKSEAGRGNVRFMRLRPRFDPIDLEIMWNQIITLIDETAYVVRRTSMSKVVVEGSDFGVMLHDARGRLVASDIAVASKISTISILVHRMLEHFPADSLKPGDVLVTNNPWWVMGHLNDIAFMAPLFFRGRLVGFAETMAHLADIGGCLSARPRELFEEGLIIPPLKAVEEGRDNKTFFDLVRANVRVPEQVTSDMGALIAGCRVLEAKLGEFLEAHGLATLDPLADEIIARSEQAMRQGIRENIPDGVYRGETSVDGFDEPLFVRVRADVRDGEVEFDFEGTSPQCEFGINCSDVYRDVWCAFAVKCLAAPELPGNEGTFRPISAHAPTDLAWPAAAGGVTAWAARRRRLRIVDGLESADSGTIRIDGAPVTGPGPERAMVFQGFDLFPWRTTLENVAFGLEVRGVPADERREMGQRCIDLVGLQGFENAYPYQLSGGMQQRVGIARALAIKPDILLMDEPFGSLDIQTRELLQDELLRIHEAEAKTVVFVTHSIEEAIYLADRVVVLSPRPARICTDIEVPFGRPRSEDIKGDPEFVRIRHDIWQLLKSASAPPP